MNYTDKDLPRFYAMVDNNYIKSYIGDRNFFLAQLRATWMIAFK